jgi:hypothetical protein
VAQDKRVVGPSTLPKFELRLGEDESPRALFPVLDAGGRLLSTRACSQWVAVVPRATINSSRLKLRMARVNRPEFPVQLSHLSLPSSSGGHERDAQRDVLIHRFSRRTRRNTPLEVGLLHRARRRSGTISPSYRSPAVQRAGHRADHPGSEKQARRRACISKRLSGRRLVRSALGRPGVAPSATSYSAPTGIIDSRRMRYGLHG